MVRHTVRFHLDFARKSERKVQYRTYAMFLQSRFTPIVILLQHHLCGWDHRISQSEGLNREGVLRFMVCPEVDEAD